VLNDVAAFGVASMSPNPSIAAIFGIDERRDRWCRIVVPRDRPVGPANA
jgi:hypothetical protein